MYDAVISKKKEHLGKQEQGHGCYRYNYALTLVTFRNNLSNFKKKNNIYIYKNTTKKMKISKNHNNNKKPVNSVIFQLYFFYLKKLLSSLFCLLRKLVFDQSSPVHLVSESRGGTVSVTKDGRGGGRKFLFLILDDENW